MSGEPRPIVGSAIYANLVAKKQRIESSSYKKVFAVKKSGKWLCFTVYPGIVKTVV